MKTTEIETKIKEAKRQIKILELAYKGLIKIENLQSFIDSDSPFEELKMKAKKQIKTTEKVVQRILKLNA